MRRYKVFFHQGEEIGIKTHVRRAEVLVSDSILLIQDTDISIPLQTISETKLFRLHGLGRVIQIDHTQGRLFLSVVRLMIGQFAFINFWRTGELYELLKSTQAQEAS